MTANNITNNVFSRVDLELFRSRQICDLDQRSFQLVDGYTSPHGEKVMPVNFSELEEATEEIESFALAQVDKMKTLGIDDQNIRIAVLGSIQSFSSSIGTNVNLNEKLIRLMEKVNNNIDRHIHCRMSVSHP